MSNKLKDAAFLQESETGASDANLCGEEAGQEEVNIFLQLFRFRFRFGQIGKILTKRFLQAIETSSTAAGREELGEED